MIRTTYPDKICYRPGCDVHECLVLLPEGVRIGERATCPLGNPDEVSPDSDACSVSSGGGVPTPCTCRLSPLRHSSFHLGRNFILPAFHLLWIFHIRISHIRMGEEGVSTSPVKHVWILWLDISHPTPDAGWERRTFQLLRSGMSGSSDNAYSESFSLSIQYRGVLLKLPDISDRLFEIFCFRYLMSKSPNSPCNPPIIGFLSLYVRTKGWITLYIVVIFFTIR